MSHRLTSLLLAGAVLAPSEAFAALHQGLTSALAHTTFDYIIVGGGAAGAVVANRLSEDHDISVLLIEAGSRKGSDFNDTAIEIPGRSAALQKTRFDWNFTTTPQVGYDNRSIAYPRGHVLGGSTAINVMAYCRGSRDDYDRWARVTGDYGWSWDSLFPYILNLDRVTPSADGHSTAGQFNPDVHGHTGLLNISLANYFIEPGALSINASHELSSQFPFNLDFNSGNTVGLSYTQQTIYKGARFTSAHGYLAPFFERPNLDVVVNTLVTKVVQTGTHRDVPAFRAVQVYNSSTNTTTKLTARHEVILSAGAVKSPHLLMLSGIGDTSELSAVGIEPLVSLPDVGKNLQDHVFLPLIHTVVPGVFTLNQLRENATFAAAALAQWTNTRTGPLTLPGGDTWGWFRLPASSSAFEIAPDPSAGETSAHYEAIIEDTFISKVLTPPSTGNFLTLLLNLISPASRGTISLASADPLAAPLIDPRFLTAPVDIAMIREAIRAVRVFLAAPAWQGWITGEYGALANATTDAELDAFARSNADSVDHVSGTVAMGPRECTRVGCGALNPDLSVKGTVGLRVVDASAFPFIISGHTQGSTYILAERASDIIKNARH
ncbi:alcohol oxidase [Vararia minispora EC-137]|uniref:Alcohol oxidase n=1 Tax=Vararia minispora EC-137 TaxID=1314806 RepID=A0ACB8QQA8_9AGAM|nr:alcohol oxidase [Vararia minispora EC-137]